MQSDHRPATDAFSAALLRILQRTELMLQRRIDGSDQQVDAVPEGERCDDLAGLEVQDSDWGVWLEAGGDLLMGQPR